MTNAETNERFVRHFYELFARGEADGLGHLFADDFLFVPAGKRSPLARPRRGPREIFEFTREQMELTGGTWIPRPYDVLATARHVVVLVTVTATRDGQTCQFNLVHVWHFANGLARELRSYVDDQYLYDQFLS
jgi:ketosteroid isomerase-like protein